MGILNNIDKFIDYINELDQKYCFTDEEVEKIREFLYGKEEEYQTNNF